MVRLGPLCQGLGLGPPPAFNPTVVRLGLASGQAHNAQEQTFNPTVVRLGLAQLMRSYQAVMRLSIPLWCDWDGVKGNN